MIHELLQGECPLLGGLGTWLAPRLILCAHFSSDRYMHMSSNLGGLASGMTCLASFFLPCSQGCYTDRGRPLCLIPTAKAAYEEDFIGALQRKKEKRSTQ